MNRARRLLTVSNLLAAVAIFLALGGAAYAGTQIGTTTFRMAQ
jgi:hypothetical protein